MIALGRTMAAALAGFGLLAPPAHALSLVEATENGLRVFRYIWVDSHGLTRSVSLKKQIAQNPGNGGYAVRMTYQYVSDGLTREVVIRPTDDGDGFGYFVSHERYRRFADGKSQPIAQKIFRTDDSPLGKNFPVQAKQLSLTPTSAALQFRLSYPRYGTLAANGLNPNTGEDNPRLGTDPALFKRYDLGVRITWYFEDGRDYPRIVTRIDMSDVPGPDRVSFDVRGPYGKMDFDPGNNPIAKVMWGDRYHFETTGSPLTRKSGWTWNRKNNGARYVALIAGNSEFGLVEPRKYRSSATNDGYAEARSKTSGSFNGGNGCPAQPQLLPCDWEWAYQSAQYELPANGTTTSEKIAWGSTAYFGMSLDSTYDGQVSVPFEGFPDDKVLSYETCLVYGRTTPGGLAKSAATGGGSYNCASK